MVAQPIKPAEPAEPADGRRRRGDRTRKAIAARAASLASIQGLEAVTIGGLATELGISKGGIQAAYPSKEELQMAAVRAATDIFLQHVVEPALDQPAGMPRLRALIDAWLAYVEGRVLPGGCFMAATVPEYDSRTGPVREALAENRRAWLGLLEEQVRQAQDSRELAPEVPPQLLAFEIDALLTMGNNARNLADDLEPLGTVRTLLDLRLRATPGRAAGPAQRPPSPGGRLRPAAPAAGSSGPS